MSVSMTREPYIPHEIFKNRHKFNHVTRGIRMYLTIYAGQLSQPIARHGGVAAWTNSLRDTGLIVPPVRQ